jgi:hypothetical protein
MTLGALSFFLLPAGAQQPQDNSPVIGIGTAQVGQVFSLPPSAGASFTATVEFETTQVLSDRTVVTHRSTSYVARNAKGRTRNELRTMVDGPGGQQPETLEVILYDPETKVRTTLSAKTHRATQAIVKPSDMAGGRGAVSAATKKTSRVNAPKNVSTEEIGIDYMQGLDVKHFRERRIVALGITGEEGEVQTIYEYWYSPQLKVNLMSKRTDPRTGTQSARLTEIRRGEPSASLFEIPAGYRLITAEKTGKAAQ